MSATFEVFRDGKRWIARTHSKDFIHWSDPVDLELDRKPREHLYTNQIDSYVPSTTHLYWASHAIPAGTPSGDRRRGPSDRHADEMELRQRLHRHSIGLSARWGGFQTHLHGSLCPAGSRSAKLDLARQLCDSRHCTNKRAGTVDLREASLRLPFEPSAAVHNPA